MEIQISNSFYINRMELIIIVILVLLNGVFAMSEISLVSSRKFKLENAAKKGSKGAKAALSLTEKPAKFLSTVQIGITLIGILLGVYSGEALSGHVSALLSKISFLAPYAAQISGPIVVVFITYISIVFGELFPKQLGMTFPEKTAVAISQPMQILSVITSPFVWLLTKTNELLLTIFGIKKTIDSRVSEEEIKSIVKESAEGGEIEDIEHDIVERVFELGDTKANSLFTYRNQLMVFDLKDSYQEVIEKIKEEPHSAYPVTEDGNLDKIVGVVLMKDVFLQASAENFDLQNYMRKPVFVTEHTTAYRILEAFKKQKIHYGIVIDEYGNTQGMLTMDDVMDALLGDMSEEDDYDEFRITQRSEDSWLVDGQFSLKTFSKEFPIDIPEEVLYNIQTVAGFILNQSSELPDVGDSIEFDNFVFEIIDKDGQRIDKILLTKR